MIFLPLPVLVTGGHIGDPPPFTWCDVTYFAILHLEIVKLKQQFQNCFHFHLNYFSIKSSNQTYV